MTYEKEFERQHVLMTEVMDAKNPAWRNSPTLRTSVVRVCQTMARARAAEQAVYEKTGRPRAEISRLCIDVSLSEGCSETAASVLVMQKLRQGYQFDELTAFYAAAVDVNKGLIVAGETEETEGGKR